MPLFAKPCRQIKYTTADKHTQPECKFSCINHDPQGVDAWFEHWPYRLTPYSRANDAGREIDNLQTETNENKSPAASIPTNKKLIPRTVL